MAIQLQRHLFTVSEYHRMGEAGIFSEDDRVELIEGEIVEMSPIGVRHAACVRRLNKLLSRELAERAIVGVTSVFVAIFLAFFLEYLRNLPRRARPA